MTEILVFGAVAGAVLMWAAAEWMRPRRVPGGGQPNASRVRVWRWLWTASATLMLVHSLAAFGAFYNWSHATARLATARQTEAAIGIPAGVGLYVNYALLAIFSADVLWSWLRPDRYQRRSPVLDAFIRGFIFFMFLNGAVVFADGLMRIVGIVAVLAVVFSCYRAK